MKLLLGGYLMRVNKVQIEGINHRTNITFDLTAPETILIGENGIGKSTALSILNSLTVGNMVSIATCVFERIIITDDETTHVILHSDCLIEPDLLASWFERDLSKNNTPEYNNSIMQRFRKMCEELQQKDLYGKFISDLVMDLSKKEYGSLKLWCDFDVGLSKLDNFNENDELRISFKSFLDKADKRDPNLVGRIFPKYRKMYMSRFSKNVLEIIIKYIPYKTIEEFIIWHPECHGSNGGKSYNALTTCFPGSKVEESVYIKNINNNVYENLECIYSDLVNQVSFRNEGLVWVDFEIYKETRKRAKSDLYKYFYSETYESASEFLDELQNEMCVIKCKGFYSYDYENEKEGYARFVLDMCRREQFDLDSVISYMCFNQTVANDINKQALSYEHDCLDKLNKCDTPSIEDIDSLVERYDEEFIEFSNYYIQPFLAHSRPFSLDIRFVISQLYDAIANDNHDLIKSGFYLLLSYYEFCKSAQSIIRDKYKVPKDASRILEFIEHYIYDKSFTLTPGGMIVYTKYDCKDANDEKKKNHRLNLNMLSSGEKKIILLGCLAVVATRAMLILDEPELSMTITWQSKLLQDIVDTGGFSNVIVATHSPFVAADIRHQKYIQYLL